MSAENTHLPRRPSWDCEPCDSPWPCDQAREHLARSVHPRTVLVMLMVAYLELALEERPNDAPAELYVRFLTWTRST